MRSYKTFQRVRESRGLMTGALQCLDLLDNGGPLTAEAAPGAETVENRDPHVSRLTPH